MTDLQAQYKNRAATRSDISGHLKFLFRTAIGRPAIAELGVRTGNSTCALLAAIEATGRGHLWSTDIAQPWVPEAWHQLPYWHFLLADDLSADAKQHVPARIDMLLIDTSHDEQQTLDELDAYGTRVLPGGVICCHDTHWAQGPPAKPGGVPSDIELRDPAGPVARALDTWCRKRNLEWENRPGSFGMGVIWL